MKPQTDICLLEPWMCLLCADIAKTAPDPWQLSDFEALLQSPNHPCWVLLENNVPVGFACFLTIVDSADLQLITIAPSHRKKGYAEFLLKFALRNLLQNGIQKVLLEVRCGNTSALALYHKLGFQVLALRKNMYRNPAEDGFLMTKKLSNQHADLY